MKAGRELDALVAEKVMGCIISFKGWRYGRCGCDDTKGPSHMWTPDHETYEWPAPYSTDIAAAWEVVEKMGNWHGFDFAIWKKEVGEWRAGWFEDGWEGLEGRADATAESAPHAICLAALKAVGALQEEQTT